MHVERCSHASGDRNCRPCGIRSLGVALLEVGDEAQGGRWYMTEIRGLLARSAAICSVSRSVTAVLASGLTESLR